MAPITVFTGHGAVARAAAVERAICEFDDVTIHETAARTWTFARSAVGDIAVDRRLVVAVARLDEAFPSGQMGGTRLVLTQSAYQMQRWLDWIERRGNVTLVAEADAARLRSAAPEAFARRGPWSRIAIVDVEGDEAERDTPASDGTDHPLEQAFRTTDAEERLALCRRALEADAGDPAVRLALASAYMEVQDLDASQLELENALGLAPEWEAVHYEHGKLWLRRDDLERAGRAFAEAGRLMPSFSAAFSNLGATLGELDRTGEALQAFQQALRYDPDGYTVLNNIGVLSRELGRLGESEAALRKVIAVAPDFVFGHYNLGHTLFLQGRYQAALSAYTEGQRRDPEKNPRQACRIAVVRLAAGDPEGSLRDLQRCTRNVPDDQKREILSEAQEILWALLTDRPDLAGWRTVSDAVKSQLDTLA